MAEHIWSVLCDRSVIDKYTNQISLLNVIESIRITVEEGGAKKIRAEAEKTGRSPVFGHKMQLVTWWVRSDPDVPETIEIQIANYSPSGERGGVPVSGRVDLVHHRSYRIQVEIGGVAYKGDGLYWIVVERRGQRGWEPVSRLPVNISLIEAPRGSATNPALGDV